MKKGVQAKSVIFVCHTKYLIVIPVHTLFALFRSLQKTIISIWHVSIILQCYHRFLYRLSWYLVFNLIIRRLPRMVLSPISVQKEIRNVGAKYVLNSSNFEWQWNPNCFIKMIHISSWRKSWNVWGKKRFCFKKDEALLQIEYNKRKIFTWTNSQVLFII